MSGNICALNEVSEDVSANKPRVLPRIHDRINACLTQKELLFSLVDALGSPLNLVFPQNLEDNVQSFQNVYKKHRLRGRIHFTSKPCKSRALLRQASLHNIGVDVSSVGSLRETVGAGWSPNRIGATGPKNYDYILTALQLDVLLNIDNIDELKLALELHGKLGLTRKISLTVRISGFESKRFSLTPQDNTFGILIKDMPWVFDFLIANKDKINFRGFSFHMSAGSDLQRLIAMENQMELTIAAIKKGLAPKTVNIGGGFPITYADNFMDWTNYINTLKETLVSNDAPSQTWNNDSLGFRVQGNLVSGTGNFMDQAPDYTKGDELNRWLNFRLPSMGNVTFADIIRDSLFELDIEPGRGMLDQCGITLGRVNFTKESTLGETLIGLDMNHTNLHSVYQKRFTEPVVIHRDNNRRPCEEGVYYVGNLCLSYDMLQYNKTYPHMTPQTGDIVAFMNTAAYSMDFAESETLMQPTARKVAMTEKNGTWSWALDENYIPLMKDA